MIFVAQHLKCKVIVNCVVIIISHNTVRTTSTLPRGYRLYSLLCAIYPALLPVLLFLIRAGLKVLFGLFTTYNSICSIFYLSLVFFPPILPSFYFLLQMANNNSSLALGGSLEFSFHNIFLNVVFSSSVVLRYC